MKTRFSTFDLICEIAELQTLVGMRVNKVYDVDKKTYIIKLQKPEDKRVLIVESGARIHATTYEWPKNDAPSGFTMKLRKHINNKRLEVLEMVGRDRIIHMQFGSGEAAFHLIVELYDKGNLILTDKDFLIMNLLRPRIAGEEKFLVRETYTLDHTIKSRSECMNQDHVVSVLKNAKPTETLKKLFLGNFDHGPALMEHFFKTVGVSGMTKLKDLSLGHDEIALKVVEAFDLASKFVDSKEPRKGYIVLRTEVVPDVANPGLMRELSTYEEFHPVLFKQHESLHSKEFETFNQAIDEFFSQLESQKIDLKVHQQERQAFKKLENIKLDHTQRISQLVKDQHDDRHKGDLIEMNATLVDRTLTIIRSAIANQMDWKEIEEIVAEAAESGDPILSRVKNLRLDINHISMLLWDPYAVSYDSDEEVAEDDDANKPVLVDLDLDISAQGNVRKYHEKKKAAVLKELKTKESQTVALKSAEKKTKQILREVAVTAMVTKARKTFWFEKFFWFISTENYLVIAGRDQQQNELVVKRYMRPGDIYVHADLHGASSVIVKNPTGKPVPPKTLNEAGHMAVCYSVAWDSKVVTSAWWVESSQVSKSAPTGEYLPTGSFMVRGKKNFLPPSHLILGYGILFRVSEENVAAHANDRKVRVFDEESIIKEEEEAAVSDLEEIPEEEDLNSDEGNDVENSNQLEDIKVPENVKPSVEIPVDVNQDEETVTVKDESESKDEAESGNSSDSDGVQFPDTTVKIDFSAAGKGIEFIAARRDTESSDTTEKVHFVEKKGQGKKEAPKKVENKIDTDTTQKRGKKGKMKKLKMKYKDQTEEERELRMQILQGKPKAEKPEAKKQSDSGKKGKQGSNQQSTKPKQPFQPKVRLNEEGEEVKEVEPANDEVDMLDGLVSNPLQDDELLFALPVVGPYNSMLTWKFKVKATPGISKKGKAIKTAMNMFINDKNTSTRERDLLRSMKEQDLARNLPGKVKLSAPMLHKNK